MKAILIALFFNLTAVLYGQQSDSLGIDNNEYLNSQEVIFFADYFKMHKISMNFDNKRIAFLTGNLGSSLITKSEFFKSIRPWYSKGEVFQILLIPLSPKEKLRSGGYDALIISWCKVFTNNQKRKTLKKLKEQIH